MDKKWLWLAGASVIGLILAILMMPSPDTGSDIPELDRTIKNPRDFSGDPEVAAVTPPPIKPGEPPHPGKRTRPEAPGTPNIRRDLIPTDNRAGPNPIAAQVLARQMEPESVFAGRASAPFTLIRRQLLMNGSDEAKEIADDAADLIGSLRENRRNPEAHDWADLDDQMQTIANQLRGSEYESDPHIAQSLERLDSILAEFDAAKNR